jgi:GTP-binding protein EngB required for normal cell division
VLANKIDRISKSRRRPALAKIAAALGVPVRDVLPFSASKREGLEEAWRRIDAAVRERRG